MYELTRDKYLQPVELTYLKASLEKFKIKDPKNTALLELLLATGCRGSEVIKVTAKDLIEEHCSVYIRATKGSRNREIPLPLPLFQRLKQMAPADGPIFNITTRMIRHIWAEYRPSSKGVHSLRHTAAIRLYEKTRDIKLVQTLLGHKSLLNTMIYADFLSSRDDLRKALVG